MQEEVLIEEIALGDTVRTAQGDMLVSEIRISVHPLDENHTNYYDLRNTAMSVLRGPAGLRVTRVIEAPKTEEVLVEELRIDDVIIVEEIPETVVQINSRTTRTESRFTVVVEGDKFYTRDLGDCIPRQITAPTTKVERIATPPKATPTQKKISTPAAQEQSEEQKPEFVNEFDAAIRVEDTIFQFVNALAAAIRVEDTIFHQEECYRVLKTVKLWGQIQLTLKRVGEPNENTLTLVCDPDTILVAVIPEKPAEVIPTEVIPTEVIPTEVIPAESPVFTRLRASEIVAGDIVRYLGVTYTVHQVEFVGLSVHLSWSVEGEKNPRSLFVAPEAKMLVKTQRPVAATKQRMNVMPANDGTVSWSEAVMQLSDKPHGNNASLRRQVFRVGAAFSGGKSITLAEAMEIMHKSGLHITRTTMQRRVKMLVEAGWMRPAENHGNQKSWIGVHDRKKSNGA